MKLAELKEKFKNKYLIRIAAGVLIVTMAGSGAAAGNVYAAKNTKTETNAAEETERDEDISFDKILSKGEEEGETEVGKDETVYIIADSTGKAEETIVSEWLKNPEGKNQLKDVSDLKEIENVKGDESFTQKGSDLTWKAGGNDIYYQGKTSKEAPVTEKITYYLDGKEISAKEIAGKNGKVKIRFDYTNHEKTGDVYVPFMVISGMVLDSNFTNVQVTNGKVISNGDSSIVVGAALPGLKESLKVKESDFSEDVSIPEYVEVTADAEKFELDMTMTVVAGASALNADASLDFSEIDDKIEDLTDAMGQLKDGSKELKDGLDTLNEKTGEFSSGLNTLQNGITAYTDGAGKLANGINALKGQSGLLISGISDLVSSVGTLNSGVKTLDQALNTPMGNQEKSAAMATAKAAAENAVEAQFADPSNPQSYQNIKNQASDAFYSVVTQDAVKQAAAASAKEQAAAGIQGQKPAIAAAAKEQAAAGIQEQKPAIAASAKEQAVAGISGQLDSIAASAKDQAIAAAGAAISDDVKNQLRSAFTAAGYVQAAQAGGITVEQAMANAGIQASVTQAAESQLQSLLGNIGTAAGTVADQTARTVANQVAGGVAEQIAGGVADQVAGSVAEQVAGSVAEQVAGSVAEQVAPQVVTGIASQAKDTIGTTVADSVKQGAKTAAGQAAGQAAVEGAESAKKQIAQSIEKKDAKSGYSLVTGMKALHDGVGTISDKMPQLKDGIDQLDDGGKTLASKNSELNDGTTKLVDGKNQMIEGIQKLADGSGELADGIVKFDEEGIEKLVNSYNGDIKDFTERIQQVLDAGGSYESFGGKTNDVKGSVKFIIKTGEIKAEDKE